MEFTSFFQKALGANRPPYDYQIRLAGGDTGGGCRSQLINIPTGLGKTAAVVLAWLWNRVERQNPEWPRRLVYCLPMRTLVEQTEENVREWLEKLNLTDTVGVHVLMGGEEAGNWDIYPERPAILIGTQDMLLSRALNRGYGMSRYRWPMHFGLLNNDCLWVMDETQLMGPGLWTSGQLDWMRQHRLGTVFSCLTWWMSATNGESFLDTPDRRKASLTRLPITGIGDDPAALSRLNSERPVLWWEAPVGPVSKKKAKGTEKIYSDPLTFESSLAKALIEAHQLGTLSLAVCNSVKSAQALYRELTRYNTAPTILLTSRFRANDRKKHTDTLLKFEAKRKHWVECHADDIMSDCPGLICVSTQVIEAGVDISAHHLWSELAPWPSMLQRLGRLNRDGKANGKAPGASFFQWPTETVKGKRTTAGPYEAPDLLRGKQLLEKLVALYESKPDLGAFDAVEQLRQDISTAEAFANALQPKPEPFPRAIDIHGLFSTEPDAFGGFTDVSPWVRGEDKNADVTVFWREFDAKKNLPRTVELTGNPFDSSEGCSVSIYRFRDSLGEKGRALVWDDRVEEWQSVRGADICPGMVVMLPRTAGRYSAAIGWTGDKRDRLETAPLPGPFSIPFKRDPDSEQDEWVTLADHLKDAELHASGIVSNLGLPDMLGKALIQSARQHDIGKAHPQWQGALPSPSPLDGAPWAKFPRVPGHLFRPDMRHEAASALALWHQYFRSDAEWPALTVYLVAAHHGKVRTVLTARRASGTDVCGVPREPQTLPWPTGTAQPMDFACAIDGMDGEFSADGLSFTPSSPGWTGLVADLLGGWEEKPTDPPPPLSLRNATEPRLLGPFSLAYLEALLRAVDGFTSHHPSKPVY